MVWEPYQVIERDVPRLGLLSYAEPYHSWVSNVGETKEPKVARKKIQIALGIICIILAACLGGAVPAYTTIINRESNTISSLNYQISQLNSRACIVEGVNQTVGLQLTMTLQKTNYSLSEPINMTFTMTNISNQTINLGQYADYRFGFKVYNDTNNNIYQTSLNFPLYPDNPGGPCIIPFLLNAEESFTETLVWGQTCNNTAFSEGVPVSPGTYYIVGQTGYIFNMNGLTVETTPIKIVID